MQKRSYKDNPKIENDLYSNYGEIEKLCKYIHRCMQTNLFCDIYDIYSWDFPNSIFILYLKDTPYSLSIHAYCFHPFYSVWQNSSDSNMPYQEISFQDLFEDYISNSKIDQELKENMILNLDLFWNR